MLTLYDGLSHAEAAEDPGSFGNHRFLARFHRPAKIAAPAGRRGRRNAAMKHFDLESKIKSLPVPDPGEEFWQSLPQRVLARARAAPGRLPGRPSAPFTLHHSKFKNRPGRPGRRLLPLAKPAARRPSPAGGAGRAANAPGPRAIAGAPRHPHARRTRPAQPRPGPAMKPFQPAIVPDMQPIPGAENLEASAPKIVEELIHQAERASASDIHLQMDHGGAAVSFRLDGLMTPARPDLPPTSPSGFSAASNSSRA